ncbi:MAG: tRNA 2-thiocytidine(32) synthetase TtcA [Clostridia bacterium]|jgi:tRNA(Ile)-lysidine synthase TilS/MesJ|nr:tRNA 2-thiocytidine(32) synthetase TtcA [Clostridia bacterium]
MKELQRILSFTRRAVDDYDMIKEGDKIAVGVSSGKDSLTLLTALAEMRRFYPKKYDICAITVDMGFEGADFSPIAKYCEKLNVEYKVVKTEIAKIIFDVRKESNPCSLCSKMRRGVLNSEAKAMGCNSVALGHHFDDAVETFMMNIFFEGRLGCFSPVTYLSQSDINVIRPLIYAKESDVLYFSRHTELPIIESSCPENHATEREKMKELLRKIEAENKGLRHRIFSAMCKGEIDGFKAVGRLPE